MLQSITLKFTESEDLTLDCSVTTILVGPNNSGKSLVLREIESALAQNPFPHDLKILRDYSLAWPSEEEIDSTFKKFDRFKRADLSPENVLLGRMEAEGGFNSVELRRDTVIDIAKGQSDKQWFSSQVVRWGMLRLDGRSRFALTNDQPGGDILATPTNVLSHLFKDDKARDEVRSIIKDAFGLYFTIDPFNLGQLRIKLSTDAPGDEQSLNQKARDYQLAALHIKNASDGVQAFTGIVTAVLSGEFHTILVDEPEAFLHPPLARKLGKHLTEIAAKRGGTLMAATHSADFLMGCVQAGKPVQVVRLEHHSGKSKGRLVDSKKLAKLLRSPLMRSANVVGGLFHDGVVVTESDNDRVFYSEIYHRLAAENENYPAILFVNAQNKQTMRDVISPLRDFGIPAAAIADIDIVKDGGANWSNWLKSAQIPQAMHIALGQQRSTIKDRLNATGKNMKTDGGINILNGGDKAAAEHLFDTVADFGIFVVRGGELENWLPSLGVAGKKTAWTVAMLQALGDDPSKSAYVHPAAGDVWEFHEENSRVDSGSEQKGNYVA